MSTERHLERNAFIGEEPARIFAALDDPVRFGAHMSKPSAAMFGGSMRYELDAAAGKSVGSVIHITGRVLGFELSVSEKVTERTPPFRKSWETVGEPRLLLLVWYRMGFRIAAEGVGSRLTAFIDFRLPESVPLRTLSRILGPLYAQWCLERIVNDAQKPSLTS